MLSGIKERHVVTLYLVYTLIHSVQCNVCIKILWYLCMCIHTHCTGLRCIQKYLKCSCFLQGTYHVVHEPACIAERKQVIYTGR